MIELAGADRARSLRRRIAADIRAAREDAGLSLRRLSRAAGISHAKLSALERGTHDPHDRGAGAGGGGPGMDLRMRLYPGTGPLIRDRHQAAIIEALLGRLHDRWHPSPEV